MVRLDDFVTTAQEKLNAGESIISTEQKDAINTGIVDKRHPSASHAYGSSKREPYAEDITEEMDFATKKSSFVRKTAFSIPLQKMTNKLLEDSELEGADDLYYKGKRTYQSARKAKNYLTSLRGKKITTPPSSIAHTGQTTLAKTPRKETITKSTSVTKKQASKQSKQYFKKKVYKTAAKRSIQKVVVKKTLLSIGKPILGKIALIAAPILLFIFAFLLGIILLTTLFSSSTNKSNSFGSLSGVQLEVAQALRTQGFRDIQIAAIMGNISEESGWNPTAEYHGNGSSYEYGYGLFQFTDTTPGAGNYTNFKNWATANGKEMDSVSAQTEYFINQVRSSWGTALHSTGYYAAGIPQFIGKDTSYSAFLSSTDLAFSTYAFLACYERPAAWAARSSYPDRYAAAQKFYDQLTSSGGGELNASSETQQKIVSAAHMTPFQGIGWCAAWVSSVYQNAGFGYIGGNANDMYRKFANNHDRSQLKVGMVVAVERSSSGNIDGWTYGHVGIYIGDGKVMHNSLSVETISLDDWISLFGQYSPVGWGYPPSVSGK